MTHEDLESVASLLYHIYAELVDSSLVRQIGDPVAVALLVTIQTKNVVAVLCTLAL